MLYAIGQEIKMEQLDRYENFISIREHPKYKITQLNSDIATIVRGDN